MASRAAVDSGVNVAAPHVYVCKESPGLHHHEVYHQPDCAVLHRLHRACDCSYVQRAQPHGAAEERSEHLEWRGYDGELRADAERSVPGDADARFAALWW